MTTKTYRFAYSTSCNMCGSGIQYQTFFGRRLDQRQGFRPKRKLGITTSIVRCRTCSLVYPNPMPIPESLEQHYNIAPEQYWGDQHFEVADLSSQIDTFTRLSGMSPNSCSALDIGAGTGNAMIALGRAGFDVHGIEPSPSFRRAAIDRMGVPEQRLQLASIEGTDFPDDSFDFINFAAVVEHLINPAAALEKVIRWLTLGGLMYVEVPSSAFLLSRIVRLFYWFTGAGDYVINTCPMHVPFHLYEFGLESFTRHGLKAGYSVALHQYYPCASYMPRWAISPFNAIMRRTSTGMQLAVWLTKHNFRRTTSCK